MMKGKDFASRWYCGNDCSGKRWTDAIGGMDRLGVKSVCAAQDYFDAIKNIACITKKLI